MENQKKHESNGTPKRYDRMLTNEESDIIYSTFLDNYDDNKFIDDDATIEERIASGEILQAVQRG